MKIIIGTFLALLAIAIATRGHAHYPEDDVVCWTKAADIYVKTQKRDAGITESAALERASDMSACITKGHCIYQDAEDKAELLANVKNIYNHPKDSAQKLADDVYTQCMTLRGHSANGKAGT